MVSHRPKTQQGSTPGVSEPAGVQKVKAAGKDIAAGQQAPQTTPAVTGVKKGSGGGSSSKKAAAAAAAAAAPSVAVEVVQVDPLELEHRIQNARKMLADTEKQIYNLETQYFETANPQGNAIRGYDGLLSGTSVSAKRAAFKAEDRIFSGSSTSGYAHLPGGVLSGPSTSRAAAG